MYKVLIADDEDIIRRGLASLVAQNPKLEVSALAEDGEIALEKAKAVQPDLLLVDINMPFMDGLAFIREIRGILPDAEIIIVTGYDDFALIQNALRLGVSDYILKPVMEEPFYRSLDKVIRILDEKQRSSQYMQFLLQQMEKNRFSFVNSFFQSWLNNSLDAVEIENRLEYLKIQIPRPYAVTLLHLRSDPNMGDTWDDDLLLFGCNNITQEVLAVYGPVWTFHVQDNALAVVTRVFSPPEWETVKKNWRTPIEQYLRVKVELIQEQGSSIEEFPDVVEKAMHTYRQQHHYSELVLQAIRLIDSQWDQCEFSLQSVADTLHVSAQHMSRLFRRETGSTFGSYLTHKRITEAMHLLQNPNLKMYEIAERTGYSTQHYFSGAFKKALGMSPAEYRKSILG